jgi:tetraacyldisaccharide 4'-kinase
MWRVLHDAWWRLATQHHPRTFSGLLVASALQTGSLAYRVAVGLRNAAYDRGWVRSVQLPCTVVSVGNLTVGGTGKTACVELVARKLLGMGRRVAVLSRGYGGTRTAPADEPQLLARHLDGVPVLVGARRDQTGRSAASAFGADTVILDDGFQHRRVKRDCEIVLVSSRMPLGGWALLPRGPMREPLESLARAEIVIITKADEALEKLAALRERLRGLARQALVATAVHEPVGLLDVGTGSRGEPSRLSGMRVALVSSIGDPEGFEATVRRLQASVLWHEAFPDHHRYTSADWQRIVERSARERPEAILTTEKDWVRLTPFPIPHSPFPIPLWVLEIQMKLHSGEAELDARLAGLYAR